MPVQVHVLPIFPAPPRPPAEGWTADYGNQLNRWLTNITTQLAGWTFVRASHIMVPNTFYVSAYGLRVGEVYANDGILTVVLEGDIGLDGVEATGSVGDLTITV